MSSMGKEGATIECPSCKEKIHVVAKGPPKNQSQARDITYVNDKGEECFFVAKVVEKPDTMKPATEHHH